MPAWSVRYYDDKTNEVLRSAIVRAATKEEADKIIIENALVTDFIGIAPVPIDESMFALGYTAQ